MFECSIQYSVVRGVQLTNTSNDNDCGYNEHAVAEPMLDGSVWAASADVNHRARLKKSEECNKSTTTFQRSSEK
jgi:hypothetical protein